MKSFESDGVTYEVVDIVPVSESKEPVFEIREGEFAGTWFKLSNLRIDNKDDSLLWYDLEASGDTTVDQIKPIVDNFILSILVEQIQRTKNENQTAE